MSTITISDDRTPNTFSSDRATVVPSAKFAEQQFLYMPDEPVSQSTKAEDKLLQKNSLKGFANTESASLRMMLAKAKTFD